MTDVCGRYSSESRNLDISKNSSQLVLQQHDKVTVREWVSLPFSTAFIIYTEWLSVSKFKGMSDALTTMSDRIAAVENEFQRGQLFQANKLDDFINRLEQQLSNRLDEKLSTLVRIDLNDKDQMVVQ